MMHSSAYQTRESLTKSAMLARQVPMSTKNAVKADLGGPSATGSGYPSNRAKIRIKSAMAGSRPQQAIWKGQSTDGQNDRYETSAPQKPRLSGLDNQQLTSNPPEGHRGAFETQLHDHLESVAPEACTRYG